ncbi:hypothetical protein [Mucilaginibacter ginsenosidivorax]|uniref:Uncharacterized protein n=1 Tax=Mucilaginibacter ginsenosidivorax TaxID=862126 RepID=A0A5B8W386_9SPHI|nr:hypothetical protein [Mucilaginibacter ginsenosidivorax]QEC77465.1 hypothetical protein FSB76_16495 [Mucilaginibacter ginsenosidivorax]
MLKGLICHPFRALVDVVLSMGDAHRRRMSPFQGCTTDGSWVHNPVLTLPALKGTNMPTQGKALWL